MSGHLISGRDFRYDNITRAMRTLPYKNLICPPISEILPTPLKVTFLFVKSGVQRSFIHRVTDSIKKMRSIIGMVFCVRGRC